MQKDENGYIIEQEELEQEYESSYFLMLTIDVLADQRLTDLQKLLYAAITGLCRSRGYCWASNAYFEKLFNKKNTQISTGISKLVELGYIKREIVYKKKEIENGEIITTKQIAYRKLSIILNSVNQNTPILENQNTPILENQKEINNNLINNISSNNIKLLEVESGDSTIVEEKIIIDNEIVSKMEDVSSAPKKAGAAPEQPAKKKGGLAPLIDAINIKYDKVKFPRLNELLLVYLRAHLGRRRLPSLEKWKDMLDRLDNYSSIQLVGASGTKFLENNALAIVEKAINAKGDAPYPDFDDIFKTKIDGILSNDDFGIRAY